MALLFLLVEVLLSLFPICLASWKVRLKSNWFTWMPFIYDSPFNAVVEACYFWQRHKAYDAVSLGHMWPFCVFTARPGSGIMLIGCMLLHRPGIIEVPWHAGSLWCFIWGFVSDIVPWWQKQSETDGKSHSSLEKLRQRQENGRRKCQYKCVWQGNQEEQKMTAYRG